MSITAKITKIKNKTKSKVLFSGIICFQYLRHVDGTLLNENFTVTTEAPDYSCIAAFSCINLIIHSLQKKFPVWSDGSAPQFPSRFVYTFQWYYNERHHGKGPMDCVGETAKNMISQHIKSK